MRERIHLNEAHGGVGGPEDVDALESAEAAIESDPAATGIARKEEQVHAGVECGPDIVTHLKCPVFVMASTATRGQYAAIGALMAISGGLTFEFDDGRPAEYAR
jgi:hypothetical protein